MSNQDPGPDGTGTTSTTATTPTGGATTFYYVDGALYREREGFCQEVLNGDQWQYLPLNVAQATQIDEAQAQEYADGADLQAENAGTSPALDSAPKDGSGGE